MGSKGGIGPVSFDSLIIVGALLGAWAWNLDGLVYGMWAGFFLMVFVKMKK